MSSEIANEQVSTMQYPVCAECKSKESAFWHQNASGDVICNFCHESRRDGVVTRTLRSQALQSGAAAAASAAAAAPDSTGKSADTLVPVVDGAGSGSTRLVGIGAASVNSTRKSNRLKPATKTRAIQNVVKPSATKGRSRKVILKKNPLKAPTAVSSVVLSDYIFFQGNYWQIGDVVSVTDEEDGQTYYAQIRGFLQDQYCSKSAVITWLIPTTGDADGEPSPLSQEFDPKLYVAGPEEDLPRDMAHFEFVCHAPSDYFNHRSAYCSRIVNPPALGCVWTRFGPEIQTVNEAAEFDVIGLGINSGENDSRSTRNEADQRNDREVGKRASLGRDKGQSNKVTTASRQKEKVK